MNDYNEISEKFQLSNVEKETVVSNDNIDFLLPDGQTCTEFVHSTLYAAGEVYQSAIIDTLTCASYFNEHLVTVM